MKKRFEFVLIQFYSVMKLKVDNEVDSELTQEQIRVSLFFQIMRKIVNPDGSDTHPFELLAMCEC